MDMGNVVISSCALCSGVVDVINADITGKLLRDMVSYFLFAAIKTWKEVRFIAVISPYQSNIGSGLFALPVSKINAWNCTCLHSCVP